MDCRIISVLLGFCIIYSATEAKSSVETIKRAHGGGFLVRGGDAKKWVITIDDNIKPPVSNPKPVDPWPAQAPNPAPVWSPAPKPAPVWSPAPKPAPVWSPAPKPAPVWSPAPKPAPVWSPAPKPASVWSPAPKPAPVWSPAPQAVDPWPAPAPNPAPVWSPAPKPADPWPAPAPKPWSAPAPVWKPSPPPADPWAPPASGWNPAVQMADPWKAPVPVYSPAPAPSQVWSQSQQPASGSWPAQASNAAWNNAQMSQWTQQANSYAQQQPQQWNIQQMQSVGQSWSQQQAYQPRPWTPAPVPWTPAPPTPNCTAVGQFFRDQSNACRFYVCTAAADPWMSNGATSNFLPVGRTCANGVGVSPSFVDGSAYNPCTVSNSACKARVAAPHHPSPLQPPHAQKPAYYAPWVNDDCFWNPWHCKNKQKRTTTLNTPSTTSPATTPTMATTTAGPPVTTPTPTPAPGMGIPFGGCPDPFVSFNNTHVLGGTLQAGITTFGACQTACLISANCRALDFDSNTNQCFFFSLMMQGQAFILAGVTHLQKTQCTGVPAAGAAATFLTCTSATHILNGTLQPNFGSIVTCQNMCALDATCQAIDFNFNTSQCFFHGMATSCNTLIQKPACVHCKRVACDMMPAPNTAPTGYSNEFIGFHILGGTQQTGTFSLQECLAACTASAACLAADYNKATACCWFHAATTACNTLVPKNECTNFRKSTTTCPAPAG